MNPPRHPKGWRRHLYTLGVKLFLAIAGANIVLVVAAYQIYSHSFDRGLLEYLNKADEARLTPLIQRLADGYREHAADWTWIADDKPRWQSMLREEVLGNSRYLRHPHGERPMAGEERSAPPPALTIDPRMLLLDRDGEVLIGPADRVEQALRKTIEVDGEVVGYLAYIPRLAMVESLEQVFQRQQAHRFLAIAIGMLAAVLINAALIAHWLARRLNALRNGANRLAEGDYGTRIAVVGHDEFAQLSTDFNNLASALESVQRSRRQWIADIAHELRTPLTTLRAEIEALQDGVRPLTRAGLNSLAQESNRLTRLVEDLHLLSLSDLGALRYHFAELDLGEVVRDCLEASQQTIAEGGLAVELSLASDVLIHGDEIRLQQVLGNLLQNTLRYTDPPRRLRIELTRQHGEACLRWQDSAPGVDPQHLASLTERLYRVDEARDRASGGSGLGLAIANAIIEDHGGRLEGGHSPLGGLSWRIQFPLPHMSLSESHHD
ncbi:ATP-binding protein [Propionivibrio limicola]|uniref:ATP-binding protein n=1 Tax=Propionivibrio limicola TaxID=167645 RepID=UPI00147929ED|nr:ATP-binding protein [Propionivibrio limicola]